MDNVYVSTIALRGFPIEELIAIANERRWSIEFSSGLPYREDMERIYLDCPVRRVPHNYFPAPEIPFVLNLASADDRIRERSIQHCIHGMELARNSGASFFSAHAGFCIDPAPDQLGNSLPVTEIPDREHSKKRFLGSLQKILEIARKLDVGFLAENNVIAPFNYNNSINPLLCCDSDEIEWVCRAVNDDHFGILLDTAHLKVSCNTLQKDLIGETIRILPFVKGIHHSDNDGKRDTNDRITADYWFQPFMQASKHLPHVLEVKDLSPDEIDKQLQLLKTVWN